MHAQALRELGYVAGVSEHMAELPAKDLRPRVDPRLWEGMSASPRCTLSPSLAGHARSLPRSTHSLPTRAGNVRPGRVLVAHPRTPNESWHHAVVLLLEYSPEQGALGLLINRPGTWPSLPEFALPRACERHAHSGRVLRQTRRESAQAVGYRHTPVLSVLRRRQHQGIVFFYLFIYLFYLMARFGVVEHAGLALAQSIPTTGGADGPTLDGERLLRLRQQGSQVGDRTRGTAANTTRTARGTQLS